MSHNELAEFGVIVLTWLLGAIGTTLLAVAISFIWNRD